MLQEAWFLTNISRRSDLSLDKRSILPLTRESDLHTNEEANALSSTFGCTIRNILVIYNRHVRIGLDGLYLFSDLYSSPSWTRASGAILGADLISQLSSACCYSHPMNRMNFLRVPACIPVRRFRSILLNVCLSSVPSS
jgi:hypothetical protein